MNYQDANIVVTTAVAVNLRKLSQMLEKQHCDGMFKTELSSTGLPPATHFISAGATPKAYVVAVTSPTRLYTTAKAAWEADGLVFPFTQLQVTNALNKCTVTDGTYNDPTINPLTGQAVGIRAEGPHELIARLNLQFVRGVLP